MIVGAVAAGAAGIGVALRSGMSKLRRTKPAPTTDESQTKAESPSEA